MSSQTPLNKSDLPVSYGSSNEQYQNILEPSFGYRPQKVYCLHCQERRRKGNFVESVAHEQI